jgi:hypothetical protein
MCSAYVDINLFLLLAKSHAKKIVVFTGASHAYRLLTLVMKKKAEIILPLKDELLEFVELIPHGSLELEIKFLSSFEGN